MAVYLVRLTEWVFLCPEHIKMLDHSVEVTETPGSSFDKCEFCDGEIQEHWDKIDG